MTQYRCAPENYEPDRLRGRSDGPRIGGFWVLKAADLDEALVWGRKAAVACHASVEVRPFHWQRTDGSN